jgi:hypothetical protein
MEKAKGKRKKYGGRLRMHLALGFEIGPASSRRARGATIPVAVRINLFLHSTLVP